MVDGSDVGIDVLVGDRARMGRVELPIKRAIRSRPWLWRDFPLSHL
jgi:hypothetical protein